MDVICARIFGGVVLPFPFLICLFLVFLHFIGWSFLVCMLLARCSLLFCRFGSGSATTRFLSELISAVIATIFYWSAVGLPHVFSSSRSRALYLFLARTIRSSAENVALPSSHCWWWLEREEPVVLGSCALAMVVLGMHERVELV